MRLIDADRLNFAKVFYGDYWTEFLPKYQVDIAETIDAEPITRCKDCNHWVWPNTCGREVITRYENDFCSRAERKEVRQCVDRES